jgi:hypothetical protein
MSSSSQIKFKSGRKADTTGEFSKFSYGMIFPMVQHLYDATAKQLGVPSPSSFVFANQKKYADLFDSKLPLKVRKQMAAQTIWHDATEGIKTFSSLLAYYRSKSAPEMEEYLKDESVTADPFVFELELFLSILQEAADQKDSFRIEHEF